MKKIFLLLVLVLTLAFSSIANADYPNYLNGDPNYPICGGHMGYGMFIDRSSIRLVKSERPFYQISFSTLSVPDADRGNVSNFKRSNSLYLYNYDEKKMYAYYNNKWNYIPPIGSMAETGHYYPGELAFYFTFKQKFYGGTKWYDRNTGTYQRANCDYLYDMLGM